MLVSSHKREEDGPAPIPMDPDTGYLVQVFINMFRPVVTDDTSPDGKIFLKADGAAFLKGTIGRRISAFVVKSGIRPDTLVTATDFRKWIVTELKRKKRLGMPIDEDLLRCLMCHSDKTAKKWYLRESLTEQAAEASEQIAENTQPSPSKITTREMSDPDEDECAKPSPSKMSLSSEELQRVSEVFKDDVAGGILPRKMRVKALMWQDLVLRTSLNSQIKVKKILDRVQYLQDNKPYIDPFQWSEEESALIEKALSGFDKCPRNPAIQSIFHSTKELEAIYNAKTFERIRNKVKNIFRKRNTSGRKQ